MRRLILTITAAAILFSLPGWGKESKKEEPVKPPDPPVQQPADPQAVSDHMNAMKAAADRVIKEARGGDAETAFQQGALEIHCAMRPEFGPANAWLFNEREGKLRELAEKLKVSPERAEQLFDSGVYDSYCHDLDAVEAAAREAGFEVERAPANRSGLLWSPAPGLALRVTDQAQKVEYRAPYAGTPAGPDEPPGRRHPRLTVFTYPPVPGRTVRHLMTRQQPGEPWFFTGSLVAFTLQEPQSGDVSPELVAEPLMTKLESAGLIPPAGDQVAKRVQSAAGRNPSEVKVIHGLIMVRDDSPAPPLQPSDLAGLAIVWTCPQGSDESIELIVAP